MTGARAFTPTERNRLGLDYRAEARRLGSPPVPIVDAHAHINGGRAAAIYKDVCDLYGVDRVYSQTQIDQAEAVRDVLVDRVEFIAIPSYMDKDRARVFREGFLENVIRWDEQFGARCVKFWQAPRFRDFAEQAAADHGVPIDDVLRLDSPWRLRIAEEAVSRGMMLMVHIADPDTWFATKYADTARYGAKRDQYDQLRRLLEAFPDTPLLGAHMLGWPEDLDFLDSMLEAHPNLILDTSATKWMVRELSRHPDGRVAVFLHRWAGRVLFGSDVVTSDRHLEPTDPEDKNFAVALAHSPEEAFDLYASRYWALRTLFETDYRGESNIADPDLMLVDPERYDALSAPELRGQNLPPDLLTTFYRSAALDTMQAWFDGHR